MAQAQATRTWVSGVGDDVNPCSRTAPCKTFAGAISKTATAGEISVLDPGGFGALTITKSITVNGEGTLAGNLAAGISGFTINALDTSVININDVSINGNNTAGTFHGVRILQAGSVNLEDVSIYNFSANGIDITESSDVKLSVNRVTIRNVTGAGIRADTSAGLARVSVKNSHISGCGTGISGRRNSRIVVKDSVVTLNTIGVHSESNGGTSAIVALEGCTISLNTSHGIQAGGGISTAPSAVRISDNIIANNSGAGVTILANGLVDTFLNNEILGNSPDGCTGCTNASGSFN
jgi:hypothetical protein